jgi:hypothetical protein
MEWRRYDRREGSMERKEGPRGKKENKGKELLGGRCN